jgi:hypothetical protein
LFQTCKKMYSSEGIKNAPSGPGRCPVLAATFGVHARIHTAAPVHYGLSTDSL